MDVIFYDIQVTQLFTYTIFKTLKQDLDYDSNNLN